MTLIKLMRLPLQLLALLLHALFIILTVNLFLNLSGQDGWFAMLFTLLIVIACEFVSFIDAGLFLVSKHSLFSLLYLVLLLINAALFMTVIYYDTVGSVIGLSLYGVLFIIRIVNFFLNLIDIFKTV